MNTENNSTTRHDANNILTSFRLPREVCRLQSGISEKYCSENGSTIAFDTLSFNWNIQKNSLKYCVMSAAFALRSVLGFVST